MKAIRFIYPALLICSVLGLKAEAGIIVGNGAGLVEQNIQFVYMSLPKIISGCFDSPNQCSLSSDENSQLLQIEAVIHQNLSLYDRIQFVSEKQNPGFFTTSSTENNRIAKTGLTPQDPIYFNVDELYDFEGKPAIDFAGLAAILIHEIGHQTGELSHTKLDILGAKVRISLSFQFSSFDYSFINLENVEMNIINYPMPSPLGDIYLSAKNGSSIQLTSKIMQKLRCASTDQHLIGFNITNSHWNHVVQGTGLIDFEAWLQIFCTQDGNLITLSKDLLVRVSDQAKVTEIEVR